MMSPARRPVNRPAFCIFSLNLPSDPHLMRLVPLDLAPYLLQGSFRSTFVRAAPSLVYDPFLFGRAVGLRVYFGAE